MVQALDGGEPWVLWAPEHGVSEIAWSPDGRRMAFVAAQDKRPLHRRQGGEGPGRHGPPDHPGRLALGRRRPPRPLGPGLGRAGARGREPRRLTRRRRRTPGRSRGRPTVGRSPSPPIRVRTPTCCRSPSIWVVPAAGGAAARGRPPRRVRGIIRPSRPTGAGSPASAWMSPSRSTTSSPALFVAPFDPAGTSPRPAVALAPDLDRPIGAWNDTDLNGWMASSRPGRSGRRRTPS